MSEALPHRPSAEGAGAGRAPPSVRTMVMRMSCAIAPTRSTRSARDEKTYRAPQRTYRLCVLSASHRGTGWEQLSPEAPSRVSRRPEHPRPTARLSLSPSPSPASYGTHCRHRPRLPPPRGLAVGGLRETQHGSGARSRFRVKATSRCAIGGDRAYDGQRYRLQGLTLAHAEHPIRPPRRLRAPPTPPRRRGVLQHTSATCSGAPPRLW